MSINTVIKFPVTPRPAEVLVDSLLSEARLSNPRGGADARVSFRIDSALGQVSELHRFIISELYPISSQDAASVKGPDYDAVARKLNHFPNFAREELLNALFGLGVITAAHVKLLEAQALQTLRNSPTAAPLGPPNLRLVA